MRAHRAPLLALAAMLAPLRVSAAEPPRIEAVVVYGDDPCPQASGDEIVVCSRQPEGDRYRIPKALRGKKAENIGGAAWGARVAANEQAARVVLPGSCSAIGSYGQSGCTLVWMRQWSAARRALEAE